MASLDSRFICTSDLDTYYVDNASGLPMSGGIVTFYSDVNRTVLKPVYQLTGTPGNYTYAPLNNPCTLSNSGTFQDGLGNNIVPYYYPFTGTPAENTGEQELYYITVVNSGFVPQFTRQGWPQAAGSGATPVSDFEIENYIPNGQFLAHNDPLSLTEPPIVQWAFPSGETVDGQAIAQGGWYFAYTNGTTATFNNSFSIIPPSGGWGMNSFPRYIFNFVCTGIGNTPTTRDLRITWPDVNKFSSGNPPGTTPYTLFFDARSNDTNSYTFSLYQIYYFGSTGNGGAPSDAIQTLIAEFTVGPGTSFQSKNIQGITFPANQGEIGANNDDYVALSIRGPTSGWNAAFTDFALVQGDEILTSFPVQTNDEMLSRGVAGFMPTPDPMGFDMYLPLVLTPQGMTFDHAIVGTIVGKMTTAPLNNELYCDGSMYVTSAYSAIGIPYARLQKVLWQSTYNLPLFGTGTNFVEAQISSGATSQIILCTNTNSSQTAPSDGTTGTGFAFNTVANTGSTGYAYRTFANAAGSITFVSNFTNGTNSNNSFAAGTSGMVFTNIDAPNNLGIYYGAQTTALTAAALSAGSSTPGLYFTFSNHTTNYYFWFKVNGETDPAPGGTGIQCNLVPTMTVSDVANIIACVMDGYQTNSITCGAASTVAAGSWLNFFANAVEYSVWYQKANLPATQPTLPGTAIKVVLAGTETSAQVATLTQQAINMYSFAVPDLRGMFLRGLDSASPPWDLDQATRTFNRGNTLPTTLPGSIEIGQFTNHMHPPLAPNTSFAVRPSGSSAFTSGGDRTDAATTGPAGGSETRPVNTYVNYYIKY